MKTAKIVFWVTTGFLVLTQGILPILTYSQPDTVTAIAHLGYPVYFPLMLAIFKLAGGVVLIVPQVPARLKEWAYAGFVLDFIAAFYSFIAVDGVNSNLAFPIVAIIIISLSYWSYHKIQGTKAIA